MQYCYVTRAKHNIIDLKKLSINNIEHETSLIIFLNDYILVNYEKRKKLRTLLKHSFILLVLYGNLKSVVEMNRQDFIRKEGTPGYLSLCFVDIFHPSH